MTEAAAGHSAAAGVDVVTAATFPGTETTRRPRSGTPASCARGTWTAISAGASATVTRGDSTLTVVNLLSPSAQLPGMRAPQPDDIWPAWLRLRRAASSAGAVVIDLHGESPWEKMAFATAVDGQVTAVVGTHTHDPSLRGHILPAGAGLVTELGMTGRLQFTGAGFDPAHFAAALRGQDISALPPYELAAGAPTVGAVLITAEQDTVTDITRLSLGEPPEATTIARDGAG